MIPKLLRQRQQDRALVLTFTLEQEGVTHGPMVERCPAEANVDEWLANYATNFAAADAASLLDRRRVAEEHLRDTVAATEPSMIKQVLGINDAKIAEIVEARKGWRP